MRIDHDLTAIIEQSLSIEVAARTVYQRFSEKFNQHEAAAFWHKMALEEGEHIEYWEELLELSKKGMIPPVFDKSYDVHKELDSLKLKVDDLVNKSVTVVDPSQSLLMAYRMEFYLLYPAFETLFHFIRAVSNDKSPEDDYADHLRTLNSYASRHGFKSPEIDLLSETIEHLWLRNKELVVQTYTDPLTEVHNRRGFFHVVIPLSYLAQRNRSNVAALMIDIDHFKAINDQYGHQAGDSIIMLVAHCIKAQVRRSDVVGRHGGEEFIAFLVNADTHYLSEISERIRSHVEEAAIDRIPVTVSIGVASDVLDGDVEEGIDRLVRTADECLYQAKESGRNRVVMNIRKG